MKTIEQVREKIKEFKRAASKNSNHQYADFRMIADAECGMCDEILAYIEADHEND